VSHDLRTPLASIAGAASTLIEHAKLDEPTRTGLAMTIYNESDRLGRILRNVLDVTRLESGPVRLRLEWNSLEEIIGSALRRTKQLLSGRQTVIDVSKDLPLIYVDGTLFEQVFINLLENAAKHTPATSVVSIRASAAEGNLICDVSDDGPGFPPGEHDHVFEKLYQSPSRGGQGFGLGLAICRAVISAHGGTITAENRASGGAQFRIELPLSKLAPV
jgi:two-component system sensor histidine kinase KdpD